MNKEQLQNIKIELLFNKIFIPSIILNKQKVHNIKKVN
jgi:hypothetical protein